MFVCLYVYYHVGYWAAYAAKNMTLVKFIGVPIFVFRKFYLFAKLSQAPALAGLSLALFPVFPATGANPADPANQTQQE